MNIHSGEKFDFAAFVPLQLQAILENISTKKYLINQSGLKNIIVGGAAVNDWILSEIATINIPIYGTYGMTETVSHVAIRPLNGIRKSEYFTKLEGVQLDVDERDCLKIRAECTRNQWIQTHDIVELTNEKFKLLGRANRVVNSGGVKIYLDILEKNIENDMFNYLNKNVRYFLFGEKDEKLGKKLVLVVEAKEPELLLSPSILFKNTVSEKYKLPQKIYYVTNFIETNSGKIDYLNSFRKIACN